eukprot:2875094-Pleurochrysis_carterae.AAC.3
MHAWRKLHVRRLPGLARLSFTASNERLAEGSQEQGRRAEQACVGGTPVTRKCLWVRGARARQHVFVQGRANT